MQLFLMVKLFFTFRLVFWMKDNDRELSASCFTITDFLLCSLFFFVRMTKVEMSCEYNVLLYRQCIKLK